MLFLQDAITGTRNPRAKCFTTGNTHALLLPVSFFRYFGHARSLTGSLDQSTACVAAAMRASRPAVASARAPASTVTRGSSLSAPG